MRSKSSCFSSGRIVLLARRPWRSEFMEAAAFPGGVFGPVECRALRRFAAICLFVVMQLPLSVKRSQWAGEGRAALANIDKKRRCYERAMGR
jgi:hypothetical protein